MSKIFETSDKAYTESDFQPGEFKVFIQFSEFKFCQVKIFGKIEADAPYAWLKTIGPNDVRLLEYTGIPFFKFEVVGNDNDETIVCWAV